MIVVGIEVVCVVSVTGPPHCDGCGRVATEMDYDPRDVREHEYMMASWREVGPLHAVCPHCQTMPWTQALAREWASRSVMAEGAKK